jgi:hypothetical protein
MSMLRNARSILRGVSLRLVALFCAASATASAQLTFNFVPSSTISTEALNGFRAAGDRWSALFSDRMQVNINIDFTPLATGVLGSASSSRSNFSYSTIRGALATDATTADDATAVASLFAGVSIPTYINYTGNNPNGYGSATPYLDDNNSLNNRSIVGTSANFKALNLIDPFATGSDGTIRFSSLISWDFDPSNGITSGTYDFIGVATHEIGHALGFFSGVDALDTNSPRSDGVFLNDDAFRLSVLDLYRYSELSSPSGINDLSADERTKYFSIDDGRTSLGLFSTGAVHGQVPKWQASHWINNLPGISSIGLMDPALSRGETARITELDLRAFDVIGYNRILAVPEPSTYGILATVMLTVVVALRRRQGRGVQD